MRVTRMTFSVRVPVLSVQITVVEPSVSTEERRRTRLSLLGHPPHACREGNRRDGRQALRNRRDREKDARLEHEPERDVAEEAEEGHERREPDREEREAPAELLGLLLERCLLAALFRDEAPDAAQLGAAPDSRHDEAAPAAHDRRPGVGHRRAVGERRLARDGPGGLRDGDALSGERRLVDLEVASGRHAAVGGDDLPAGEDEEVARPEVAGGDLALEASAHDAGGRAR